MQTLGLNLTCTHSAHLLHTFHSACLACLHHPFATSASCCV
jgi:hypothetical protein